ncbi:MAG: alkaline phosphatase family protein [Deltaproteobacteria bacterium]|nr:alkaline phosphatase family protein [Deltaproteobacteria bacterium]
MFSFRKIFFFLALLLLAKPAFAINDIYVVHLVLDGARYDLLSEMTEKGELPNLKEYFLDHGATFDHALTVFPTVSTPGYVSFATGLGAGNSGIVFLEWLDRPEREVVGYLTLEGLNRVDSDFLNFAALRDPEETELYPPSTLFEKLKPFPTAAIYTPFRRGASTIYPQGLPFPLAWNGFVTENASAMNAMSMERLHELFARNEKKIPRYTFVALYGTDYDGHKKGPHSDEIQGDLKKFDFFFKQFTDQLKERGLGDKTYIIVSSDHGMHDTEKKFSLRKILNSMGFKGKHSIYVGDRGVSSTFIYMKGEEGWKNLPTLERLKHFPVDGKNKDLIQTLLADEGVHWVATRDGTDRVRIFEAGGEALITQTSIGNESYYSYNYKGSEPFHYSKNPKLSSLLDGKMHPKEEWFQKTATEYAPNAIPALADLFENPRVGDILVVTKGPWGFRKLKEGTHGSLIDEDMRIPLWIRGPGIPEGHVSRPAQGVDLYPTILSWFGFKEVDFKNQEGQVLFQTPTARKDPEAKALADIEFTCVAGKLGRHGRLEKELKWREAKKEKYKNFQVAMTQKKNNLRVPKKLKESMQWMLALMEKQESTRMKRLEKCLNSSSTVTAK